LQGTSQIDPDGTIGKARARSVPGPLIKEDIRVFDLRNAGTGHGGGLQSLILWIGLGSQNDPVVGRVFAGSDGHDPAPAAFFVERRSRFLRMRLDTADQANQGHDRRNSRYASAWRNPHEISYDAFPLRGSR